MDARNRLLSRSPVHPWSLERGGNNKKTFDSYFRSWKPELLLPHISSYGLSALVCCTIFTYRSSQQAKSCRGPFGGAERLSLGTTSPLLRAHRAQAQRSAARPRQGSVYEGSPKCSQPDLSRCTVLKNSPSFQTGQGGLATSALSSHRGTQRERNVLPSPPPGDTAGPAGKHSLPARDWERHYVTRRISSKSYFWRQQGEGQVQPPAERRSRFPWRARRSRGTAASKTCLASPGCPQAVLSHHVPRPQVALEGCSPGCPRESPQGQ